MTQFTADESSASDALHAEAANWFVRLNTREPTMDEVADWQRWLVASEAHRHAFSRFEDLWQTIGRTELHFAMQPRHDADTSPMQASAARRHWPLALAAAASIAIAAAGFLFTNLTPSPELAGAAVVETRVAEARSYALPDGSHIEVGARTRVVVDFSGQTRSVILDNGEAYFEVAHETRPFVVRAGSGTITAVGTAFNVHHVDGRVAVAVVEGAVNVRDYVDNRTAPLSQVSGASEPQSSIPAVVVQAGQGIVYGRETKPMTAVDTNVATAWREGHLQFLRESLGNVAADVERYSDIQISIADPAVSELLYTGTVTPSEIDNWLALLPHAFPVEVQRIGKRMVLLKPRNESGEAAGAVER